MNFTPRSRRDFLQLLGVCTAPLMAAVPWAIWQKGAREEPLKFDTSLLTQLQAKPPEVALVGNSMVHGRLDPAYLNELWQPLTTTAISSGATRSLQWFMWLKNLLATGRPPPQLVLLLYRDYDFHNLSRAITDRLLTAIRQTMVSGDETYLRRARRKGPSESPVDTMREWLDAHYRSIAIREHLSKKISDNAFDAASLLGPKSDRQLRDHTEEVFSLTNLRKDLGETDTNDNETNETFRATFTADPAETFLPDFVEIANAQKIKLVFYHVKRRPGADHIRKVHPFLAAYNAEFKAWAEAQGHYHINETEDASITLDMYNDADHLHPQVYRAYTEMFAKRVREHISDWPVPFTPEERKVGQQALREAAREAKRR